MHLNIDKKSKKSLFQQLVDQIELKINTGEFSPGGKLPTERVIENETGISRGTIKNAYKELVRRGRIQTIRGSGSYVLPVNLDNANGIAREKIKELLASLDNLNINLPDIERIFIDELEEKYKQKSRVNVAWVDCCKECLVTICNQMEPYRQMKITPFLLSELNDNEKLIKNDYDLIVTTAKHYENVISEFNGNIHEIEKVILDLKMSSIISISKIPSHKSVALWSVTEIFLDIMREILNDFDNLQHIVSFVGEENLNTIKEQIKYTDYLIVPPEYISLQMKGMIEAIHEYEMRGKNVILFEYQLNKGSAIHFQDMVLKRYKEKNEKRHKDS